MKKIFATAAMAISLTTHATEEAMQQALNTWQQQVADYEAAMQAADSDAARAALVPWVTCTADSRGQRGFSMSFAFRNREFIF